MRILTRGLARHSFIHPRCRETAAERTRVNTLPVRVPRPPPPRTQPSPAVWFTARPHGKTISRGVEARWRIPNKGRHALSTPSQQVYGGLETSLHPHLDRKAANRLQVRPAAVFLCNPRDWRGQHLECVLSSNFTSSSLISPKAHLQHTVW